MPLTETYCENCGMTAEESTSFCPDCGAEEPWEVRSAYKFDADDLPVIFTTRTYDDDWGLWDGFCEEYFGTRLQGDDVDGLPDDFPRLKFHEVEIFWKIDEALDLHGPFLSKEEAVSSKSVQV